MLPCTSATDYAAAILAVRKAPSSTTGPRNGLGRAPLLDVRLRDASGLTSTLGLISKSYDDKVCLEVFQGKGLQIRAIDQGKSSFVGAFFPAKLAPGQTPVFSRFECSRPYLPMWLDPGLLGKAIRTSTDARKRQGGGRASVLHLKVEETDPDHLILEAESSAGPGQRPCGVIKSTRQDLALLTPTTDTESCFVDGESFKFTAEALFECPELVSEIIADVKSSGCDEVSLTMAASGLALSGKAGDNCSRLQVTLRTGGVGALSSMCLNVQEGPVSASFKARHLLRLSHLCTESAMVLLQLGPDTPLSVTFQLPGGGTCQLFIAPTLEDDEGPAAEQAEGETDGAGEQRSEEQEDEVGGATVEELEDGAGEELADEAPVRAAKRSRRQADELPETSSFVIEGKRGDAAWGEDSVIGLPYEGGGALGDDSEVPFGL